MAERMSSGDANSQLEKTVADYANGVLAIFGGASQPADANDAETGTLLCLITESSGAFVAGAPENGLNFGAPVNGVISKDDTETWSGIGLAAAGAGTAATYFRFYDNTYTTGASTTAKRFDGAISTLSSAELQMTITTIATGGPVVVNTFTRNKLRA